MSEQGYDENEIVAEIANLKLLIAFCLHSEGDFDGASEYLNELCAKQQINGIYQRLIAENNAFAAGGIQSETDCASKCKLFKKVLCGKNDESFSRIGCGENGISELLKAYHNFGVVLMNMAESEVNERQFKELIALMKRKYPSSEIALFLRVSRHFKAGQLQQCRDILSNYVGTNPNASPKCKLMLIQTLIKANKYRLAIGQIRALPDFINYHKVSLCLAQKVNDTALQIEIMRECIDCLRKSKENPSLLLSLRVKLCRLLISSGRASDAKEVALRLHQMDESNDCYQAMLILAAIHCSDTDLAKRIWSKIEGIAECDERALSECLATVPNPSGNEVFEFVIDEKVEALKKRKLNQRKRAKIANKLRAKYRENPSSFKEPIQWKSSKSEKRKESKKPKQNDSAKKKKKKSFKGAQGGSGESNFYDIGEAKNTKQSAKKLIPQHIKKKRKR